MVSLRLTPLLELGVGLVPRIGSVLRDDIGDDIVSFSIRMLLAESVRETGGRRGRTLAESFGGGVGASSLLRVCRW